MSLRLINLHQVMTTCSVGKTFVYSHPNFPKPIKVGGASRWIEAEVLAWIEERIAARDREASHA